MTSPGSTHSTTPHPSTTVQSEAYAVPSGHNRCLGGRPDRRWQVFGLKGTNLSVHLVTVASQASRPSARDGARSLIPLRGSPGLSPGSLLPLPRPTPFQEEPDAPPNLARYPTPRANKSKNAVQFGGDWPSPSISSLAATAVAPVSEGVDDVQALGLQPGDEHGRGQDAHAPAPQRQGRTLNSSAVSAYRGPYCRPQIPQQIPQRW